MDLTLFGISNCDTVRKARRWLDAQGINYRFHDFRADGLDEDTVQRWIDAVGWETVLNRRSTSWKALAQKEREHMHAETAVASACATPTLVKRPVLEGDAMLEFGFEEARYAALFADD